MRSLVRILSQSSLIYRRRADLGEIYRNGNVVVKQHCMDRDDYDKEFNILTQFNHDNIISPLRSYTKENKFCVEYKYYKEGDLHHWMGIRTPREVKDSFYRIAIQAAECLENVHDSGMMHLDIKPENFLVEGESITLIDFETAELFHEPDSRTLVHGFGKKGTTSYMAPEMMHGGSYSPLSDVYSLGCMFYLILCYRFPDRAEFNSNAVAKAYPEFENCLTAMLQPNHNYRPDIKDVLCILRSRV